MFQRFLKVTNANGEQRWINLDRVTRVSMAIDSAGVPILAFCFDGNDRVLVHGTDEEAQSLIRQVATALDRVTEPKLTTRAA